MKTTNGGSELFLEKSLKLLPRMTRGRYYSKRFLAGQLIFIVVTMVLSADSQSSPVISDSQVISHSISHPISSDNNRNVPITHTSSADKQEHSVNYTQVLDGIQSFIQTGKNATSSLLSSLSKSGEISNKKHNGSSHEIGADSELHRGNNHTMKKNVTHDTMHEHVHDEVGELEEDANHEFTTQDGNPVETVRLQDILRQIFVDELDSDEHAAEGFDENDEPILNDALSRSDHHNSSNYANSTISRQGRADNNGRSRRRLTKANKNSSKSKATDLSKYNAYMDAVLKRMNSMIKSKRMDPLRVNLYAGPSKKKNGNKNKKNSPRMNLDSEESDGFYDEDADGDHEPPADRPATRDIYLDRDGETRRIRALLSNVSSSSEPIHSEELDDDTSNTDVESRDGTPNPASSNKSAKGNGTKPTSTGRSKNGGKNKKNSKENGQKGKGGKNKNSPRPTRGILHGLSTLRRDGNVQVSKQSDRSRLVRAKFLLGPVALEILPKKTNPRTGRGQGNRPVSATATAPQLKGVLEVRLKQGSPTRIKRLRVYPPGNVKVAGEGAKQGPSGGKVTGRGYNKVTPMATYRLRQVAMQVVRHADRLKH